MPPIDERWVTRLGLRDPRAGRGGTRGIERDGHDLETAGVQLLAQLLPHGQVKTTASPRRPRDEHHLPPTQRREAKRTSARVRQLEIRRGRGHKRVTTCL